MADLIDRGALYEQTAEWEASALHMVEKLMHSEDPDDIKEWIKWSAVLQERTAFKHDVADAPSALIRPKAKNVYYEESDHCEFKCSLCHATIGVVEGGALDGANLRYCPWCGAEMDEEVREWDA